MTQPYFKYDIENLEAAKKYLDTQEIYDPNLKKNVNALWFIEQKRIPKTIEWHSMLVAANSLKEQELNKIENNGQ